MGPNLFANYGEAVSAILFCIGFTNLLLQTNLIKKIIGLNIMDSAISQGGLRPLWRTVSPARKPTLTRFPAALS